MNKFRFAISAFALIVFTLAVASVAQAQATRTWVSGVGDDVNPCSRTAPCKTFAGAISKTASSGEIDALDPAGYGAVTITKPITIDGGLGSGGGSILAANVNAVIINAGASDTVILKNISMNGAGNGLNGVRILAGKHVSIEGCQIFGFGNTAAGNGRGISDVRTTANGTLFVLNTVFENNAKNGAAVLPGAGGGITAIFEGCQFIKNGDAATAALAADAAAKVQAKNCTASHNPGIGFFAGTAGTTLDLENCVATNNNVGIQAASGGTVRVSNSYVTKNATGLSFAGATMNTFGNNKVADNAAGNTFPGGSLINPI